MEAAEEWRLPLFLDYRVHIVLILKAFDLAATIFISSSRILMERNCSEDSGTFVDCIFIVIIGFVCVLL